MYKLAYVLAAACSLAIVACEPTNSVNPTPTPSAGSSTTSCGLTANTLVDEKTLFGAETAYNIAAHAYVAADGTGKFTGQAKATSKELLVNSYNALLLARNAYDLGNVCSLNDYVDRAKTFANHAKVIINNATGES